MSNQLKIIMAHSEFAEQALMGLNSNPKYLPSKYFYDAKGSRIFQDIMQLPEYYLTNCELEIFQKQKEGIFKAFAGNDISFNLIELGAGDGIKTKVLLSYFMEKEVDFSYIPMDISAEAINNLVSDIEKDMPSLSVKGKIGDYFILMEDLEKYDHSKKILLFLGSNIGNYREEESWRFLKKIASVMLPKDLLFIGFDLKKDAEIILNAYNDPQGHTAAFNLNLLQRINTTFNADFDLSNFEHQELYNPDTGAAKSYLISQRKHSVWIGDLAQRISFEKEEKIFMEISQKYDLEMINKLAGNTGFEVVRNFHDERQYFVNSLWKLKK